MTTEHMVPEAHPVLLLAAQADLIGELLYEATLDDADPRFGRFVFDATQAHRPEDARTALARGYEGRPYLVLLLAGDVAMTIKRAALESLVSASVSPADLVVVGLADNDEQRARLASIGISRSCSLVAFRSEFPLMVVAAANDAKTRREAAAIAAAAPATSIVINQSPKTGLLRDSGVITVHSTKGGSGKTTLSTNLAWALAASGRSTVLVDLNADGANADQHFLRYIKRLESYDDPDELFDNRGLSLLARRMRHDVSYGVIPADALAAGLIHLTDYLSFLPGIRDQSDYQAGVAGADQTVANLLRNGRWVEALLSQLRSPATGSSYVVVDTGTARYTALGFTAMQAADLLILVVNASMPSNLSADLKAAREMLSNQVNPLRARKLIIANQLQRNVPGAPTLNDVRRQFEFFEADRIMPVHADMPSLTAANVRGMPYLADPKNFATPLGAELLAIVNTVSDAYDVNDKKSAGLGRLFGRGG